MDDITLFSIERTRFHFSSRDVETELKRFSLAFDVKDRTSGNFRKWKNKSISLDTVNRMFGSFSRACATFGIACGGKKSRYTDDELLEFFEALWRWRGHRPALGDFSKFKGATGQGVHYDVFRRRYGQYAQFLKLFADYKQGLLDKETLLREAKPKKKQKRTAISPKLRYDVFKRDHYRCVDCGRSPPVVTLEVDHDRSVANGGTNDIDNLRTRCHECNNGKGCRDGRDALVHTHVRHALGEQSAKVHRQLAKKEETRRTDALRRIHALMVQNRLTSADIDVKRERAPAKTQ